MSDSSDRTTSRRAFATGAGLIAVALGGAAKAATDSPWGTSPTPPPPMGPAGAGRQSDLGKLGTSLYNSPSARAEFIANPQSYANKLGLKSVTSTDLANLKGAFADGFCCNGCGCS
jgi:hypothetical protein